MRSVPLKSSIIATTILNEFPLLSPILGVTSEEANCDCTSRYSTFELIGRKSGKVRVIEAPCAHLKLIQRALLDRVLVHADPHNAAMGFVRGKSIAMNARRHLGATCLFTSDIRSFFPSITATHVRHMLHARFPHLTVEAHEEIVRLVTSDGRLPQGAPTSPHIANLVLQDFDEHCHWFCQRLGAVYTRYADDINISASDVVILRHLESVVREGLRSLDMEMHPDKTRIIGPERRKTVTGLDIGGRKIRPTRAFRKKTAALVRMTEKYPNKMRRHRDRICGYLAFWYDVDPSDVELAKLLERMDLKTWAERVLEASAASKAKDHDRFYVDEAPW